MTPSNNFLRLMAEKSKEDFCTALMADFRADAAKRNPDVISTKTLEQLAKSKYNEAISELNAEIEGLKIIRRKSNG